METAQQTQPKNHVQKTNGFVMSTVYHAVRLYFSLCGVKIKSAAGRCRQQWWHFILHAKEKYNRPQPRGEMETPPRLRTFEPDSA